MASPGMQHPVPRESSCREYSRLLKEYKKAVLVHNATLEALKAARPTSTRAEYKRISGYMEQARLKFERVRWRLEQHIHDHGCC